ncbi:hypothetical protein [Ciceribacter selenitireducens]|uniref:Uncharacterized protein n=1 Tax=Ciceribacter selenitireducens ATCC BAA-1503 TaxID=1336235 RepID=A0A376AGA6_9HYPH|nr:hypothetical protein [Ciceribacter selenitireducens]SSC66836.1 unnamed protein product [Ciceribacter selenitireducens ATCC BAA-1503]
MSDDDYDRSLLIGLHKMAAQSGDGLAMAMYERFADAETVRRSSAEILPLPGLHQRPAKPMSARLPYGEATIISFPAPTWQRNAVRNKG